MKLHLWQIFALMMWVALFLGPPCSPSLSIWVRIGCPAVFIAMTLMIGRFIVPPRPLRPHVSNDAFLQKISDIIVVGIPSAFLLFFGFTCLSLNIVVGAMISVVFVGVFVLKVLQRRTALPRK